MEEREVLNFLFCRFLNSCYNAFICQPVFAHLIENFLIHVVPISLCGVPQGELQGSMLSKLIASDLLIAPAEADAVSICG